MSHSKSVIHTRIWGQGWCCACPVHESLGAEVGEGAVGRGFGVVAVSSVHQRIRFLMDFLGRPVLVR